jgi:hypothetical protein
MCLPCSAAEKSEESSDVGDVVRRNKGVGFDQFIANQIEKVKRLLLQESGTTDTTFLVLSHVIEEMEGRTEEINDVVAENADIVKPSTCNNPIQYYMANKEKNKKKNVRRVQC